MEKTETKPIKSERGSTSFKIKKLQKQYNKILCDLFEQFAPESIEEALESSQGSFGENISEIVNSAVENLKCKVLDELGVDHSSGEDGIGLGGIAFEIGGGDDDELGDQGADTALVASDSESDIDAESETDGESEEDSGSSDSEEEETEDKED